MANESQIVTASVQVGGTTTARTLKNISLNAGSITAYDGTGTGGAAKGTWSVAGFYDVNIGMNLIYIAAAASTTATIAYE